MHTKLILFISCLSWSSLSYAFNIKRTKVNVLAYVGLSNPSMLQLGKHSADPFTKNSLGGIGASIQPWRSTSFDINASRFWPDYATKSKSVNSTEETYMHHSTFHYNNTILIDLMGKTTLFSMTPYAKLYVKYGFWGLKTKEEQELEYKPDNTENNKQGAPNLEPLSPLTKIGYGIAFGPGINWRLAPRALPALSADVSAVLYFPTPTFGFLGENSVSGIFPVIKGGANWNIW